MYVTSFELLFLKNVFVTSTSVVAQRSSTFIPSWFPVFYHTHHDVDWIPVEQGSLMWLKQAVEHKNDLFLQQKDLVEEHTHKQNWLLIFHKAIVAYLSSAMSNNRYYIISPLSGNQYTYISTTKIITFQENFVVRTFPCNFPSWGTPPSWFLHTANIYQSPGQHFSNCIALTLHSTHIWVALRIRLFTSLPLLHFPDLSPWPGTMAAIFKHFKFNSEHT